MIPEQRVLLAISQADTVYHIRMSLVTDTPNSVIMESRLGQRRRDAPFQRDLEYLMDSTRSIWYDHHVRIMNGDIRQSCIRFEVTDAQADKNVPPHDAATGPHRHDDDPVDTEGAARHIRNIRVGDDAGRKE